MTKLRFLFVVGATAALGACGEDAPPPPAAPPAAAVAAKPKPVAVAPVSADGGTQPPAEVVEYSYTYNPVGKRDPFRSPIDEPKKAGEKIDVGLCPEPLCQFDLDQLTLVAVVSGDANPVAMLEDGKRIGHIVRRNTKVGKQGGKVTQILRDCIEVTEYFMTPDGKKVPNRVQMCVKKEDVTDSPVDLLIGKAVE